MVTALVTYKLLPPKIEEKLVTRVQERVRTITKIKVSPDGTKETIIDNRTERDSYTKKDTKPSIPEWSISSTMTYNVSEWATPTYGIGVSKHIILGLSGGLYATTDSQVGIILSYSF